MIDWEARIDDLNEELRTEWGVDDRQAVKLLLAAMLDCPRTPISWLILETNWYARDCNEAWFSFGEQWLPFYWPEIRKRYPWRVMEDRTMDWISDPGLQRLFIESEFDRFPRFGFLSQWQYMMQRSLRVRTFSIKGRHAINALDERVRDRFQDRLHSLTQAVLEDRTGGRGEDPPRFNEPKDFFYHLELISRLAPWYTEWNILVRNFGALAVRHAYLSGRAETNQEDLQALARVARDSVPLWVAKAVGELALGPSGAPRLMKAMEMTVEQSLKRSVSTMRGPESELRRLKRGGVIGFYRPDMHYALLKTHKDATIDIVHGRAFGVERGQGLKVPRSA